MYNHKFVMVNEECTIPIAFIIFAPTTSQSHKIDQQQQNLKTFFPFFPSKEIDSS